MFLFSNWYARGTDWTELGSIMFELQVDDNQGVDG